MPIGVFVDCLAVLAGGLAGTFLLKNMTEDLKRNLQILFGFCSLAIGINSIVKVSGMTAVVLAVLAGYFIGHLLDLEGKSVRFFGWLVKTTRLGGRKVDMEMYITVVALFCCSGFGWYGTLIEGISSDASILFAKSVLDFCTAAVFAASLGAAVSIIALPQLVVLLAVFAVGRLAGGGISATMLADLTACGGILTVAAAMRIAKIKSLPLVNLLPALILIVPLSAAWTAIAG